MDLDPGTDDQDHVQVRGTVVSGPISGAHET